MKTICLIMVGVLSCGMSLRAVDLSTIPAEATWLLDVQVANVLSSELGGDLRAKLAEKEAKRKLAGFQALTGMDPMKHLRSLTLAGKGVDPKSAVLYIRGKFDAERLTLLAQAAEDYNEETYNSVVIHSWFDADSGEVRFGSFPREDLLVLGSQDSVMRHVIDVIAGAKPSLPGNDPLAEMNQIDGVLAIAAAKDLHQAAGVDPNAKMLRHVQTMRLSLSESDALVKLQGIMTATTEDAAKKIKGVLDGLKALALLAEDPNRGVVGDQFLNNFLSAADGNLVSLETSVTTQALIEEIEKKAAEGLDRGSIRERIKERRERRRER